jgi:predicted ABC-type transport system involved in lysophospholipase L1 biosynthesis ATPase subunit
MSEHTLVLAGVGKRFRRGDRWLWVLKDVSLTVGAGEVVGVLGGRGAGKSTLLEIAAGIIPPDEGEVIFQGQTGLSSDERTELRGSKIAWMSAKGIDEFTVLKYVRSPLLLGRKIRKSDADDRAMDALERVGLADCAASTWDRLTNWQRVLVAFARGFVVRPDLMIVDDLLDAMSPSGMRQAGELLLALAREAEAALLVGASEPEALMIANRQLTLGHCTIQPQPNVIHLYDNRRHASGHG